MTLNSALPQAEASSTAVSLTSLAKVRSPWELLRARGGKYATTSSTNDSGRHCRLGTRSQTGTLLRIPSSGRDCPPRISAARRRSAVNCPTVAFRRPRTFAPRQSGACRPMGQTIVFFEIGILAVSFGIVLARRGYIAAHKRPYPSSNRRLRSGVALVLLGLGFIAAGMFAL